MVHQITFNSSIEAVAVSQNGRYMAICHDLNSSGTYKVTLWSLPDTQLIAEVASSSEYSFTSVCFTCGSKVLAYANEGAVALYDIETQQRGNGFWATDVHWMRADRGNRLVVAGTYTQVWQVWDAQAREQFWQLPEYKKTDYGNVFGAKADISGDGKKIVVAGTNTEQVLIYDIGQNAVIQTLDGSPPQARWISWSSNLHHLAVIGGHYQGVYIWNLETGEQVLSDIYNSENKSYFSFCFHPSGEYFATGSFGGYVSIERVSNGETILFEPFHHSRVWALAFTSDGKKLISGADDGVLSILDLQDLI